LENYGKSWKSLKQVKWVKNISNELKLKIGSILKVVWVARKDMLVGGTVKLVYRNLRCEFTFSTSR
jgi:hypothetical protein